MTTQTDKRKLSRRQKKKSRTQRFILVHPSTRITSSPLQTSKDFHWTISQYQFTTLAPNKLSLLPAVHTAPCSTHTLLNPSASVNQCRNPLHYLITNPVIEYNQNRLQLKMNQGLTIQFLYTEQYTNVLRPGVEDLA